MFALERIDFRVPGSKGVLLSVGYGAAVTDDRSQGPEEDRVSADLC